jgi:hypothetical protein
VIAFGIGLIVISLGAIVAGAGYVRTARRMRAFATTRGRILTRDVVAISADRTAGRWGKGGGYRPAVSYRYRVGGAEYTSDKLSYAFSGVKSEVARLQVDAIPDEVDVHYDPEHPEVAYLKTHTPTVGRWFVAGGIVGVLLGLLVLV